MSTGTLHSECDRALLSRRILEILQSWPEPYRRVFIRSHYWGDTASMISASMGLKVEDVSQMLDRCDQQLLEALRPFREESGDPEHTSREPFRIPVRDLYC